MANKVPYRMIRIWGSIFIRRKESENQDARSKDLKKNKKSKKIEM